LKNIHDLTKAIDRFADERDWGQFHSPKNLVMALSAEVGELVEEFQWLTEEQSAHLQKEKLGKVRDEVGDVLNYLLRLCSRLGIDPVEAAFDKLAKNAEKYPIEKSRGNARKYSEL
jgi:NTP pyrophosphatase (non-canonical NTP hydrolase)